MCIKFKKQDRSENNDKTQVNKQLSFVGGMVLWYPPAKRIIEETDGNMEERGHNRGKHLTLGISHGPSKESRWSPRGY